MQIHKRRKEGRKKEERIEGERDRRREGGKEEGKKTNRIIGFNLQPTENLHKLTQIPTLHLLFKRTGKEGILPNEFYKTEFIQHYKE